MPAAPEKSELRPVEPPKGNKQPPQAKGQPRPEESESPLLPEKTSKPGPKGDGAKEGLPSVEKEAEPPADLPAKAPDRAEAVTPAIAPKGEGRPEQRLMLPIEAVAPISRLKEIIIVRIKGKIRFSTAANINDKVMTWESIRSIKYEEYIQSARMNLLFLEDRGWVVQRGQAKQLVGEPLAFYKVFNYGLIVSNMIPLTQGGFETTSTGSALINGRECFGVKVCRPGYPDLTMLFDKGTRLLARVSFKGRFLDQNNRLARDATQVEWHFSDYKSIDGVKHWTKVEQWRDGRKHGDIELSEVQFYNKLDESMFHVPELEAEVAKSFADRKRFQEAAAAFARAMKSRDVVRAKAAQETMSSLRADDPERGERTTALVALEDELLQKAGAEVETLFKDEAYDKALQKATEGLTIRPSDPKLKALAASAQRVTSISAYIALATKKRAGDDVGGVLEALTKVAEILRDADPKTDESRPVKQQLPGFCKETFNYVLNKAAAKKAITLNLLGKKDYVNAIGNGTAAKECFARAKTVLEAVGDRVPDSGEKRKRLESEIKGLQGVITRAKGLVDLESGRQAISAGYKALAAATAKSSFLYEARDHFEAAGVALAKAVTVPETAAEADLRKAREELRKVARLIAPFEVDLAKLPDVSKWGKGWAAVRHGDRAWLQMNLPTGTLTEAVSFPRDFVLSVDLALVNRAKKPAGRSWKYYPDLVTVVLYDTGQEEQLRVSLGRNVDPKAKFADFACVKVNEKIVDWPNPERDGGQVALSFKREDGVLRVMVGGNEKATINLEGKLSRLAIIVNNGLDRAENPFVFLAVRRVSLTALPPAAGKGGQRSQKAR